MTPADLRALAEWMQAHDVTSAHSARLDSEGPTLQLVTSEVLRLGGDAVRTGRASGGTFPWCVVDGVRLVGVPDPG